MSELQGLKLGDGSDRIVNRRELTASLLGFLRRHCEPVANGETKSREDRQSFVMAMAVTTGKGLVELSASLQNIRELWDRHPATSASDAELSWRVGHRIWSDILEQPFVGLGCFHSTLLDLMVVLYKGPWTLEATLERYEEAWRHYEVPSMFLQGAEG